MPRTLAQNAQYIAETIKPAIKLAIEAQGVTVPSTDSFLDYADRIAEIEGGGSGYQLKDLPTGSISTVNDAAELPLNALKVSVEAQQDLHGYDHPWVGGAGKNKLEVTATTQTVNGVTFTVNDDGTINANGTASDAIAIPITDYIAIDNYILTGSPREANPLQIRFMNESGEWQASKYDYGSGYTFTPSDVSSYSKFIIAIIVRANQTINIVFKPMLRLASVSDATFEPYSNICPISGWDEAKVSDVGKNLLNPLKVKAEIQYNPPAGTQFTLTDIDDMTDNGDGTFSKTASGWYEFGYLFELTESECFFKIQYSGTGARVTYGFLDDNYTVLTSENNSETNQTITKSLIKTGTRKYFFFTATTNRTTADITFTEPQIEVGTLATDYEPYINQTTSITLPQTVYGGEWNVVDGSLSVTDGYIASYNGETLPSTWISDRDVYASGTTPTTGAEVVYKLATPTTIDLSPLSIRMLQGTNNVYADCGEVIEGEYFVDEGAIDTRKVDYSIGSNSALKISDGRILQGFANMASYHSRPLDASGNWLDVDWSKDFEIGVAFKVLYFPSGGNATIFGCGVSGSMNFAPNVYFWNGSTAYITLSENGSSSAVDTALNYTFQTDTWYFVRAKFTKSTLNLKIEISTDMSNFTTVYNDTLAAAPYHDAASICIGGMAQSANYASNSILIDTFNTYIKGDGVDWGAFTGAFPS